MHPNSITDFVGAVVCAVFVRVAAWLVERALIRPEGTTMSIQTNELLSLRDAARRTGLNYWKVWRLVDGGVFTNVVCVGRRKLVRVEDLDALREAAKK